VARILATDPDGARSSTAIRTYVPACRTLSLRWPDPIEDDAMAQPPATPADGDARSAAPFGLPVLVEVPELAGALELAGELDRLHRRLLDHLIELRRSDLAELATGVALDRWLATVGRFTRTDRRMLVATADVLLRLPLLRAAYTAGQVSWSQLRAVVCAVRTLPPAVDPKLDLALAAAVDGAADADPDALAHAVAWVVAAHTPDPDPDPDPPAGRGDRLVLQPRLDGSGGTGVLDLGPVAFAALDTVTAPDRSAARATRHLVGDTPDAETAATNRGRLGEARAANLLELCLRACTDRSGPPPQTSTGDGTATGDDTLTSGDDTLASDGDTLASGGEVAGGRVGTLLLRAELSSLLGRDTLPAQLLTTLAGGRMHVDAATARRLVDRYGFDLRLVLIDDGRIVGVGRRTAQVAGWLREATLAVHDTCAEPGCLTAARVCDTDHAVPTADGGATDVDNLAPLCATINRGPDRRRWDVTQTPDGSRTWRHRRTGLTTHTLPATWRPPPAEQRQPPDGDDDGDDAPDTTDGSRSPPTQRSPSPALAGCTTTARPAYRLAPPAEPDPREVPAPPF
jgi:hypothetical protein